MTALHNAGAATIRSSPLGLFAAALRAHFCAGSSAKLLQPDVQAALFPAFACLSSPSQPRTLSHYHAWVAKLATTEYADELVLAAVSKELQVRIVVVPWTSPDSLDPWIISSYPDNPLLPTVYLGNNDVHYVLLRKSKSP